MKTAVTVTLIIAGTFVIALPPLAEAWRVAWETQALTHGANLAPWDGKMDGFYEFGCFAGGAAMIVVGIWGTGVFSALAGLPRPAVAA